MKPFFVNCQSQHHLAGKILVFVALGFPNGLSCPISTKALIASTSKSKLSHHWSP